MELLWKYDTRVIDYRADANGPKCTYILTYIRVHRIRIIIQNIPRGRRCFSFFTSTVGFTCQTAPTSNISLLNVKNNPNSHTCILFTYISLHFRYDVVLVFNVLLGLD